MMSRTEPKRCLRHPPRPPSKAEIRNKVFDALKEKKWERDTPKLSGAISKKGVGRLRKLGKIASTIYKKGKNLGGAAINYALEKTGMTIVQDTVSTHYDHYAKKRAEGLSHEQAMKALKHKLEVSREGDAGDREYEHAPVWSRSHKPWIKVYSEEDYDPVFKQSYDKYGAGK